MIGTLLIIMNKMKAIKTLFGILMVVFFMAVSCSTAKKSAIACTEFPVFAVNKPSINHPRNRNYYASASHKADKTKKPGKVSDKKYPAVRMSAANSEASIGRPISDPEIISSVDKIEYSKSLIASSENSIVPMTGNNWPAGLISTVPAEYYTNNTQAKCDTIVLKSGAVVIGKISEIGLNEIKYRKCDYQDGPVIVISKSIVSAVIYANGSSEAIITASPDAFNAQPGIEGNRPKQQEGLGTVGFLAAILGLFVAGIPLGILAVVFGTISLNKIRKDPVRFKGKGLGIAAIIIGLIDVLGMLIILASL
jgi:hypothetical protein